jgi:hypothetical protein
MAVSVRAQQHPFVLPAAEREILAQRVGEAIRRARRSGGTVIAALGWNVGEHVDPTAVVVASRRASEPWFCFEQPDRNRVARAALGCVATLEAEGPERFSDVAGQWRALSSAAVCEPDDGLAALGGFAFAPDGGQSPPWSGFAPASLQVPEVLLVRRNGDVRLTAAGSTCSPTLQPSAATTVPPLRRARRIASPTRWARISRSAAGRTKGCCWARTDTAIGVYDPPSTMG